MIGELPARLSDLSARAGALVRELDLVMLPQGDAEAPESLRRFGLVQKQLRALRREVSIQAREVRAHFKAESLKLSSPAPLASLLDALGRPNATVRKLLRQQLARQRQAALAPLEQLTALVDRAILQAEQLRLHVLRAFPPPLRIPRS